MKGQKAITVLLLFISLISFSIISAQVDLSNETLVKLEESPHVIDNGGGNSITTSKTNLASIGQSVISTVTNTNVTNQAGFITAIYGAKANIEENTLKIKPGAFELKQNYPNPFNAATRIEFHVPEKTRIEFGVFNVLGEVVMDFRETKPAGSYTITFDSGELPSGVYFYSLRTDKSFRRRQMIIMK